MSIDTREKEVEFTPEAVAAVKANFTENGINHLNLRLSVRGGGCSGLEYGMDADEVIRDLDTVLEFDGVKVIIDMASINFLKGTTVDYKKTLTNSGFVFTNPNAKKTCGCGSSFS